MKIYKSTDGIYFGNEKDARTRCEFLNLAHQQHIKEVEEIHGKIEDGSPIKGYTTYEEIDLSDPETVAELFNNYNSLKKDMEAIKEWVHFNED